MQSNWSIWPGGEKPPGLEARLNKDGVRLYWVASKAARRRGYAPGSVRLHGDRLTDVGREEIAATCHRLQVQVDRWLGGPEKVEAFDGSVGSLIRSYQTSEHSRYQTIKWNTRRLYDGRLKKLDAAIGKRVLKNMSWPDIDRLYKAARAPKKEGGAERIRMSHGLMTMLRELIRFGFLLGYPECARLQGVLAAAEFETPKARTLRLTYEQAVAVIAKALEVGRPSIALGQALQFESTLRQEDVTGQWEPIPENEIARGGIVRARRRWTNGLTWDHVDEGGVLRFAATKNGKEVVIDLLAQALIVPELARVPRERRVGPMILDESTGRPYLEKQYAKVWRRIATAAGVPRDVWNRDSRSGGISEGRDSGASFEDLARQAGHQDPKVTARVYDRSGAEASRRIAASRNIHRSKKTT